MAALTVHDGGAGADTLTGGEVLNEIFDLIARSLPRIPLDDPVRPHLAGLAPLMAAGLGRPRAVAVATPIRKGGE